ncbi:LapA family protein [Oxynema sp. CENA135]|uniref:LapA family protein n=1 Tax=Oxynema sp. CENA135 TaxID=984206 RepID=UPI00190B2DE6|nr:LapA family protein [Oxynema sp. CENA135]MBK4731532.1 LapA family protein [Oxynema sp. CENA135]
MPALIASAIAAAWIVAIAIISVQNATLVSLQFLGFQSIQLPLGIVLALSAATGAIGGAIGLSVAGNTSDRGDRRLR